LKYEDEVKENDISGAEEILSQYEQHDLENNTF